MSCPISPLVNHIAKRKRATSSKKNDRFIGVNEMRETRVLDQGRPPARQDQVICPARASVSR